MGQGPPPAAEDVVGVMATGLCRIGHAADHIFGGGGRALAHATSGPCLQQNLVCILEGRS